MTPREQFIAWLNDARSTEIAMIPVLQNHAEDARDYPEIYERDMRHLAETEHQAERLEQMITDLGGSVSTAKTMVGKVLGLGQSVSTEFFSDELIKNFLADYAAEHFEIASYKSLIATAETIGEHQCIPVLEEILLEEIEMANWLAERIPMATRESLKIVSENEYEERSTGRRNGGARRKSGAARFLKPAALAVLLGAGAGLLVRSKIKSEKLEATGMGEGGQNALDSGGQSDLTSLPEEITVVETVVIAVDESGSPAAGAPTGTAARRSLRRD